MVLISQKRMTRLFQIFDWEKTYVFHRHLEVWRIWIHDTFYRQKKEVAIYNKCHVFKKNVIKIIQTQWKDPKKSNPIWPRFSTNQNAAQPSSLLWKLISILSDAVSLTNWHLVEWISASSLHIDLLSVVRISQTCGQGAMWAQEVLGVFWQ